jgi:DNA-binding CsgD family transcriptional regulator
MQETQRYSPDPDLSPAQHHVLSLLAEGVSTTEAAAAAGVHRNTVGTWRRNQPRLRPRIRIRRPRALYVLA